ncbi:copper resistance CopC family protein [Aestuariivirga sp.]|uniref:copper resistance CopC family protein n=1 Tax=Aestuariivirga sp. TaxID=2650926 RepID=UPI0039E3CD4D
MTSRTFLKLACAAALALSPLAAGGAMAHAKLTHSTPADGATVKSGLKSIAMTFAEALSADLSKFELDDAAGKAVVSTTGKDICAKTKCKLAVPALADGKYTLKYHSVSSDDGHVMDGAFSFTIKS